MLLVSARGKLEQELALWRRRGVRPRLWWRDDDVRGPTPALDRLLGLTHGRPIALAAIPDGDIEGLARRVSGLRHVSIGQHGLDHVDRRQVGPPSEYPSAPTLSQVTARIGEGLQRMQAAGLEPRFYTPPWNAVDPGLAPALAALGFPLLSAGETQVVHAGLPYASAEVDVLSWKRGPRFKGVARVLAELRHALEDRRSRRDVHRPVGLLTHHLVHDEAAWRFLSWAPFWLGQRFDWISLDDLASRPAPFQVQQQSVPVAKPVSIFAERAQVYR